MFSVSFRRRLRRVRGALLVEALICLFLLSFLVVLGTSSLITAGAASRASHQNVLADNLTRQIIEQVRTVKAARLANGVYTDPAFLFGPFEKSAFSNTQHILTQLSARHPAQVSFTLSPYPGLPTVKMGTVTVSWAGPQGGTRTRRLTALFASEGVAP